MANTTEASKHTEKTISRSKSNPPRRSSSRAKKLSAAMRVVDEETRRVIQQNRIDALEGDNLFDNLKNMDGEDGDGGNGEDEDMWDDYAMSGSDNDDKFFKTSGAGGKKGRKETGGASQRKTRSQGQDLSKILLQTSRMSSTNISKENIGKKGQRGKLDLAKVFYQEFYESGSEMMNFQNYLSVAAKPSKNPRRFFCSVCGYNSKYQCARCGLRYCTMRCGETHRETRCIKFAE